MEKGRIEEGKLTMFMPRSLFLPKRPPVEGPHMRMALENRDVYFLTETMVSFFSAIVRYMCVWIFASVTMDKAQTSLKLLKSLLCRDTLSCWLEGNGMVWFVPAVIKPFVT